MKPMLIDFLLDNPLVALVSWLALYSLDWFLSIRAVARTQRGIVPEHSVELNPYLQRAAASGKFWSPRFLLGLLLSGVILAQVLFANSTHSYILAARGFKEATLGGFGVMIVLVNLRHLENSILCSLQSTPGLLQGELRVSQAYALFEAAVESALQSLVCGLLFVGTGRLFFVGGSVTLLVNALLQFRRSYCSRTTGADGGA